MIVVSIISNKSNYKKGAGMSTISHFWHKTGRLINDIATWFTVFFEPSQRSWQITNRTITVLGALFILAILFSNILAIATVERNLGFLAMLAFIMLIGLVSFFALQLLIKLPRRTLLVLALFVPFIVVMLLPFWNLGTYVFVGVTLLSLCLVVSSLIALKENTQPVKQQKRVLTFLLIGLVGTSVIGYQLFASQERPNKLHDAYVMGDQTLDISNPNAKGPHSVEFFTYGSGNDRHRPEYAEDVTIKTESVDGSKLVDKWEGLVGWSRSRYWGHDETQLPRQGRVWMPQGEGPFPLVLIVHGNHEMEDFSDPGYAYLGEQIASRGYIFVSVDENFLNFSFADFINPISPDIGRENDARGWMLLEHLKLFRQWNNDPNSRFNGRVDMQNIALMGHSRGGEAVAIAAAFNPLSHYPDDANLTFDYQFNIKGIIAIAPVDGQYKPRDKSTPLSNINYFTIHGSADGDVDSFMGMSQYERIRYSNDSRNSSDTDDFHFKSSLYIAEANHGQFNSGWGRNDFGGGFWGYFLDTEHIISPQDQRQIAQVYFNAFLDVTLKSNQAYLPLFQNSNYGKHWLPKGFYVNNYADNLTQWLARYEEDIDPGTGHSNGINITGANLSQWKEQWPKLIYSTLDTHLARLAWDHKVTKEPATYSIDFANSSITTNADSHLVFSVAHGGSDTLPKGFEEDEMAAEKIIENSTEPESDEKEKLLDWHILLTDTEGNQAKVLLSDYQALYPALMRQTRRLNPLYDRAQSEIVLKRYAIPVTDFIKHNGELNTDSLASVRFIFDQGEQGALWLNDLGFHL
jgi:dienelactone hydrolase